MSLPPLPVESYVCHDPSSSEYGLWCERYGPYTAEQMREYARAAVAAEREACAALCDERANEMDGFTEEHHCASVLAEMIRARGDA